ncbi:aldehyde reductase [Diplodia corticola]|uniref:Aldehyde reductase n=1 Tax=Diplodia corticola TaxID=236234 RepID=A0A1J9SA43_9PEZI|nr:aldehyde reductase [Diplodia corticola]OJD36445.1 aldehyde reductase [Diplodia corticola]
MTSQPHPALIFGGASIGSAYTTPEAVADLLATLKSLGIQRIDTAARYPPTSPGTSERLLGEAAAARQGFTIDTKVLASGDGSGNLTPAAIDDSVQQSYSRLQMGDAKFNILYCHMPDPQTPLEDQAAGLNDQHRKGHFKHLGVSNFSPEMLSEFIEICDRKGYVKPSVYQGQYNLVCRGIEDTLFPTLRKHGIAFNAFSPLAGGFLTGRLTANETEGTRFAEGDAMGNFFKAQYDKKEMHDAIASLNSIIEALGISKIEASLRWIFYHSALGASDGVILGASKPAQLDSNVSAVKKGPLPEKVVSAMDAIWRSISGKSE